ncbi:hypothetical protein THAOC_11620, partial [Thalassiosira oceanica]
ADGSAAAAFVGVESRLSCSWIDWSDGRADGAPPPVSAEREKASKRTPPSFSPVESIISPVVHVVPGPDQVRPEGEEASYQAGLALYYLY